MINRGGGSTVQRDTVHTVSQFSAQSTSRSHACEADGVDTTTTQATGIGVALARRAMIL